MEIRTHEQILAGVHAHYGRKLELARVQIEELKEATDVADINVKIYVDTIGYTYSMFDGGDLIESFTRDMGCDMSDDKRRLECIEGLRAALTAEASRFLQDFDRRNR